ncbi:MAG TPA: hypothetical protein VIN59_06705, partial [Alphaproteobacteria bacterium]
MAQQFVPFVSYIFLVDSGDRKLPYDSAKKSFTAAAARQGFGFLAGSISEPKQAFSFEVRENVSFSSVQSAMDEVAARFNANVYVAVQEMPNGDDLLSQDTKAIIKVDGWHMLKA